MHLIKLADFMKEVYGEDQITLNSLRGEVRRGELLGGFIKPNGTYWVDRDKFEQSLVAPDLSKIEEIVSAMDEVTMQAIGL